MKKVLVFTDSHGRFELLMKMMEQEKPDVVFAMGDYSKDSEELSYLYPSLPFYRVKGNCDFWDRKTAEEEIVDLEGKRFLLSHGHLYGVKRSYDALEERAKILAVDMVLFGHTHRNYEGDGEIPLYNPGAAEDGKYGILIVTKEKITIESKHL